MNNIFNFVFAFLILSSFAQAGDSPEATNKDEKKSTDITVNIVEGKIGDINYRDPIDQIQKSIGSKRIKKSTEDLEGNPTDVYNIDVNGHKIFKHWNATSFTDPVFKMQKGLGIGARIKDFKKQYENGQIAENNFCFESEKPQYHFCIADIDTLKNESQIENMKVKNIWIW